MANPFLETALVEEKQLRTVRGQGPGDAESEAMGQSPFGEPGNVKLF